MLKKKETKKEMIMTYKRKSIMLTANFSMTARETRKQWNNIFTELNENNCKLKILYPVSHSGIKVK